ncbi:hypothetical protein [Spirosoma aerolatum]|nr:hypothetical protein [Spirosoma aerolatum]
MGNAKIVKEGSLDDPAKVAKDGYETQQANEEKVVSGFRNKLQGRCQ